MKNRDCKTVGRKREEGERMNLHTAPSPMLPPSPTFSPFSSKYRALPTKIIHFNLISPFCKCLCLSLISPFCKCLRLSLIFFPLHQILAGQQQLGWICAVMSAGKGSSPMDEVDNDWFFPRQSVSMSVL